MSTPTPPPSYTQPTTPLPEGIPNAAPGAPVAPGAPQASPVQQPSYQAAPARPALPTTLAQTNTYAVISIILVFLQPIAGIVFGHLGLNQIKRNGDAGRGLALTGLIIGYAYVIFLLVAIISYIFLIVAMFATLGAAFSEFGAYDYYDSY